MSTHLLASMAPGTDRASTPPASISASPGQGFASPATQGPAGPVTPPSFSISPHQLAVPTFPISPPAHAPLDNAYHPLHPPHAYSILQSPYGPHPQGGWYDSQNAPYNTPYNMPGAYQQLPYPYTPPPQPFVPLSPPAAWSQDTQAYTQPYGPYAAPHGYSATPPPLHGSYYDASQQYGPIGPGPYAEHDPPAPGTVPEQRSSGSTGSSHKRRREHRGDSGFAGGVPPPTKCILINKEITSCKSISEVLAVVASSLDCFDAVCMATAVHKMASVRSNPGQVAAVSHHPEMERLKICIAANVSTFPARNLANALWGLAKLQHHPGEPLLQALTAEVLKKLHLFIPQHIANTLWAYANLGFNPGAEVLDRMAAQAEAQLEQFSGQNISNALGSYAKLEHRTPSLLAAIARKAVAHLDSFTPQALSNTVWAMSKLAFADAALLQAVAVCATGKIMAFNPQNIANTVWAYANLGQRPTAEFLEAAASNAVDAMQGFSPQNLSNVLWSYAKLGCKHQRLFDSANARALSMLREYQPQSVANMVWAYATNGHHPGDSFLEGVATHALHTLDKFSPQNISNTVWAMATLAFHAPVFMTAVATEVTNRLGGSAAGNFSRQHLANLVWAYATLETEPRRPLMSSVAAAMTMRVADCNAQEISNTCWAFARLRSHYPELFEAMSQEAISNIKNFSQQNLANLAWAYGKVAHDDALLLDAIAQQACAMITELSLQHVINILWAFASLQYLQTGVMDTIVGDAERRLASEPFSSQQLSNLLWALCISQHCSVETWNTILKQFKDLGIPCGELPPEALTQIYQAHLLMEVEFPKQQRHAPQDLMARAHDTWTATAHKVRISQLHKEVSQQLTAMGVAHTLEQLTSGDLFSIDLAIPEEKIGIEADGPHHFTANTLAPTGELRARQRCIMAQGWALISVPFFHWTMQSAAHRHAILEKALAEARQQQSGRGATALLEKESAASEAGPPTEMSGRSNASVIVAGG